MLNPSLERNAAILCVAAGFATAASLSPWDRLFAPNLLFFWAPHIAVLSLPGALLGAVLAIGWFKERDGRGARRAGLATLALVLAGIAMNLGFVCARWMHCR